MGEGTPGTGDDDGAPDVDDLLMERIVKLSLSDQLFVLDFVDRLLRDEDEP